MMMRMMMNVFCLVVLVVQQLQTNNLEPNLLELGNLERFEEESRQR